MVWRARIPQCAGPGVASVAGMTTRAAGRSRRSPRLLRRSADDATVPRRGPAARTAVLVAATALALAGVLALAPAGTPAALAGPTAPVVTTTATSSPLYGTKATVRAAVRRGAPRQSVVLQVRSGGSWKSVTTRRLPRTGTTKVVTFALAASWAGARTYRVALRRTTKARAAVGKPVTITVRARTWTVSTPPSGLTDGDARIGDVSADGRFVVFSSTATDLLPTDTTASADVYLWDRLTGGLTLVSHPAGSPDSTGNVSRQPRISDDGRFVAFTSAAQLVPVDGDGSFDVYRWSRATDTVELVSTAVGGTQSNGTAENPDISGDGSRIAFDSTATNIAGGTSTADVFLWEQGTALPSLISRGPSNVAGDGASTSPSISSDGAHVAFATLASNLAQDQYPADTNQSSDIVVWDDSLGTGTGLFRVSTTPGGLVAAGGSTDAGVSGNGRYVTFASTATTIVPGDASSTPDVFRWDRDAPTAIELVSAPVVGSGGAFAYRPSIDRSGRRIAFYGDLGSLQQDQGTGSYEPLLWSSPDRLTRVAVNNAGTPAAPPVSTDARVGGDGRWVVFSSTGTNLGGRGPTDSEQVFLRGPLP